MSELWTFSGINNWSVEDNNYVDYVRASLIGLGLPESDRSFRSECGTGDSYKGTGKNVIRLNARKLLDGEAKEMAEASVTAGFLAGKQVRLMLIAPKTSKKLPDRATIDTEVYWAPSDLVPLPGLFKSEYVGYWRKIIGRDSVYAVENKVGIGHSITGFLVDNPPKVKRVRRHDPKRKRGVYRWEKTGKFAPPIRNTLHHWLNDTTVDYVLVGHSQGCNLISYFLRRAFS